MMATIQSYVRQGKHTLHKLTVDPRFHTGARIAGAVLSGLVLSAASLGNAAQPLALGLLCALSGWQAVFTALGAGAGYVLFWGYAGLQGLMWVSFGLAAALAVGERPVTRTAPLLLPAAAGLIVAVTGVLFRLRWGVADPLGIYLLRIALAMGSARLFAAGERDAFMKWIRTGAWVLSLAQIAPFPWLSLGVVAAGALSLGGPFPAAALGGLALDLARVTPVPMTAVVCLTYFLRLVPLHKKWALCLGPGAVCLTVMALCGVWDLNPLPALLVGGLLGPVLPGQSRVSHRRGETGVAQVRLEMAAGVFSQAQQLLLEVTQPPIDLAALISRTAERSCGSCPCRKACKDRENAMKMDPGLLQKPLLDSHDLPINCRKPGRLLQELHRTQEQLRAIRAGREAQKEHRSAVIQQYRYISEYLQDLSDQLGRRMGSSMARYTPEVAFCANRKEQDNGDRGLNFAGTQCRYYVALCDGMGTGLGAVDEGKTAGEILKKLLLAGFPAQYALRSLNSLCTLRGAAGAVTVDLLELQLDTGKAMLYKWGAAPSWLISRGAPEKIGTAGPPPGLSVTEAGESVDRLSLRRGETLVLCSDGAGGEDALRRAAVGAWEPVDAVAAKILQAGDPASLDDATVAVVRLTARLPGA